jgi:hypothetical protein
MTIDEEEPWKITKSLFVVAVFFWMFKVIFAVQAPRIFQRVSRILVLILIAFSVWAIMHP